ncbi:MAG: amidase [bacterium]
MSSLDLINQTESKVSSLNSTLNAVVTTTIESARRNAQSNTNEPFRGVPILLKDILGHCKGVRATYGSRLLENYEPSVDHPLVERFRNAGLIPVGRTNTSEFGLLPSTEPELHGPTKNPWDPSRSPGGSSGGSAAAVASGLVPAAHANDAGGSIRVPAACCGVFGLKPTRGRIFSGPDFGSPMQTIVNEHVITRTVRDSALILDAIKRTAPQDPPESGRVFKTCVDETPDRELKVGVLDESPFGDAPDVECRRALDRTVEACQDMGVVLTDASADIDARQVMEHFQTVWSAGLARVIDGLSELVERSPSPETLEPVTWSVYRTGKRADLSTYLESTTYLEDFSRWFRQDFFSGFDVLLSPTTLRPPVETGTFHGTSDDPEEMFKRALKYIPFTPFMNISGQPAMSVPVHWTDDGLPVGVHFTGTRFREDQLFRIAGRLEERVEWHRKEPPTSV